MIIQLESATAENVEAARRSLEAMAHSWGHEIAEAPAEAAAAAGTIHHDDGKAIDPVALASLVLSIPSAALAVLDLADRIRKRRRANELIDHAQHLAAQQVTVNLITRQPRRRTPRPDPRSAPRPARRRRSSQLSQPPAPCAVAPGAVEPSRQLWAPSDLGEDAGQTVSHGSGEPPRI